jgi:hypothetical protein
MEKKEFRINARHVGLTYPQCEMSLSEVLKKVSTRSKTIIAPGDENILYSKNMGGENNKE